MKRVSCGSRSENQRWGSKVEASWADSSQFGEGSVLGSWRLEKILKPVVKTAGGGEGGVKTRGGGPEERKHIFG